MTFHDHFSVAAVEYASARPGYPAALFDWIGSLAPSDGLAWEAGCGSGQASRDLAPRFAAVFATDPSAAQIAQASAPDNVTFAVEPGEHCSLADASVDVVCVAQALHWFDRAAFFDECARVLKPRGVLVAWGYQDILVPPALADTNERLQRDILPYWPPERELIDTAYAGFDWPFEPVEAPEFVLEADWTLPRLLGYFSSYSAVKRYREALGHDPVVARAADFAAAWGNADSMQRLRWPMFVQARRK